MGMLFSDLVMLLMELVCSAGNLSEDLLYLILVKVVKIAILPDYFVISQPGLNFELFYPVIKFLV